VAERVFAEPTFKNLDEYLRVCGPLYTQRPRPPEILARVTRRPEVSEHFFRGEIRAFDFTQRTRPDPRVRARRVGAGQQRTPRLSL